MAEHSDDKTVQGTVAKVSKRAIQIQATDGTKKTLKIVPQTLIQVEGQQAKATELKEGQQVRASFNHENGRDVAVRIESGTSGSMNEGSMGTPDHGTSGTTGGSDTMGGSSGSTTGGTGSGDLGTGSGSSTGSGTMTDPSRPASPTTPRDPGTTPPIQQPPAGSSGQGGTVK
jgi:Cu/Ag efflux protein CusF